MFESKYVYRFLATYTHWSFQLLLAVAYSVSIGIIVYALENFDMKYVLKEDVTGPEHQVNTMGFMISICGIMIAYHTAYAFLDLGARITIKNPINLFRNIEYMTTTTLILFVITILVKIKYLFSVLACVGLLISSTLFYILQDHQVKTPQVGRSAFFMSFVPFIFAWVCIVKAFYNGINIFNNDIKPYVYFVVWTELILISLIPFCQMYFVLVGASRNNKSSLYYKAYEGATILIGTISKFVLVYGTLYGILVTN